MGGSCSGTFSHSQHEYSFLAWRLIPYVCIIVVPFMSRLITLSQSHGHPSSASIYVWYSLLFKEPPAWQLQWANSSLFYTQARPFQSETKELEVRGTWLVARFVTTDHPFPSKIGMTDRVFLSATVEMEIDPSPGWPKVSKIWSFSSRDRWEIYSSLSDDSDNLHLLFQFRESTLSWHWDNRVTQSPWAELGHLCLSGDQTCSSCKMHCWMLRRTCWGMSVLPSTGECSSVGLHAWIVCVTHHHYMDSLSFKMFQWDMSKMIKSLCLIDVHDGRWFIEVGLINMLSCHRRHVQQYRAWMTPLFTVVSF